MLKSNHFIKMVFWHWKCCKYPCSFQRLHSLDSHFLIWGRVAHVTFSYRWKFVRRMCQNRTNLDSILHWKCCKTMELPRASHPGPPPFAPGSHAVKLAHVSWLHFYTASTKKKKTNKPEMHCGKPWISSLHIKFLAASVKAILMSGYM